MIKRRPFRPRPAEVAITAEQLMSQALRWLARRDYAAAELQGKLELAGASVQQAREIVQHCQAQGWQDEARFAGVLVRSLLAKGYGPRRIQQAGHLYGVDQEVLAQAMHDEGCDEVALAVAVAERWWQSRGMSREAGQTDAMGGEASLRQKFSQAMMRRGFTATQLRHAWQHCRTTFLATD